MAKTNKKTEKNRNLFGENSSISHIKKVKSNPNNWVWWGIFGLIVLFLIFYWFFSGFGKFEYKGLAFDTQKYGNDLIIYHYSYLFSYNKQTYRNNIYLRVDPRKNDVPVNDTILFDKGRELYFGINNTNIMSCPDSSISTGAFAQFFTNNQFSLKMGSNDINDAKERGQTYITCGENSRDKMIVILQSANKTEIIKSEEGCYLINVNNCEMLPAIEKFIVTSIVDAKKQRELITTSN